MPIWFDFNASRDHCVLARSSYKLNPRGYRPKQQRSSETTKVIRPRAQDYTLILHRPTRSDPQI